MFLKRKLSSETDDIEGTMEEMEVGQNCSICYWLMVHFLIHRNFIEKPETIRYLILKSENDAFIYISF